MALRAGYYGIKRFLRNKLDVIATSYDETIKSLFPRSEQAVLGAKNLFLIQNNYSDSGITEHTFTDTGVYAKSINAAWTNLRSTMSTLKKNTKYIFSCDVDVVSGHIALTIAGSMDGISYSEIIQSNVLTADGHLKVTFNTGNYNYFRIGMFLTRSVAEVGEATFLNLMLRLESDLNDTYEPYTMTNRELTTTSKDQKTAINAIITAATGAADFDAFKTAMGAITPVTRSLSLTKENITDEVKEVEPEKTVTKKRTTKKTEEV